MADSLVVLPTLHNNSKPTLTTPADIAAYLIRFMFVNPGRTSDNFESMMLSFRKIVAAHEPDKVAIASTVQSQLQAAINRYFPGQGYYITVTTSNVTEVNYNLTIGVFDANSTPLMTGTKISIQSGIITFEPLV